MNASASITSESRGGRLLLYVGESEMRKGEVSESSVYRFDLLARLCWVWLRWLLVVCCMRDKIPYMRYGRRDTPMGRSSGLSTALKREGDQMAFWVVEGGGCHIVRRASRVPGVYHDLWTIFTMVRRGCDRNNKNAHAVVFSFCNSAFCFTSI